MGARKYGKFILFPFLILIKIEMIIFSFIFYPDQLKKKMLLN